MIKHSDFEKFVWAWLPPASFEAIEKVTTDEDVKRFFSDAWDAFKNGKSAVRFGEQWTGQGEAQE